MKRLTAIIAALALSIIFLSSHRALAAFDPLDRLCTANPTATVCVDWRQPQPIACNSIFGKCGIITKGINILSIFIGIAGVAVLIISGFKFISSGGDTGQIAGARRTAIFAVVGVITALLAQAIIFFVLDRI